MNCRFVCGICCSPTRMVLLLSRGSVLRQPRTLDRSSGFSNPGMVLKGTAYLTAASIRPCRSRPIRTFPQPQGRFSSSHADPSAQRQSSETGSATARCGTVLFRFAFCNALSAPRRRISGILSVAPGRANTVAMPILTVSRPSFVPVSVAGERNLLTAERTLSATVAASSGLVDGRMTAMSSAP
jgi:hypothetical protein